MATLAQVKDGLTHLGGQLTAGTAITAEFLASVLTHLVVFADVVGRLESDHHRLTTQTAAEVGGIKERASQQQGALEVLMNRPDRSGGSPGTRGILESKAVSGLSLLGTDKSTFRHWNERLINAVSQVRYGSRKLFKAMMDYVDQEMGGNFEEKFKNSTEGTEMESGGTT